MPKKAKEIIWHPTAYRELVKAKEWSLDHHGKAETRKYYGALIKKIEALASNKEQGKIRGEFFSDFIPSIRSNQHLIYYLATKNKLLVVGVLHDQQSHPEHMTLRESEHEHLGPEKYIERIAKLGERLEKSDIKKADPSGRISDKKKP